MLNVNMTREGNTLVIKVDLSERHGLSASGKTTIIASTQGNVQVPAEVVDGVTKLIPGVKIGLNVYTK